MIPEPTTESEKVTFVVNGLKDIALSEEVPMIAIVAADKEGLKASRLRNYHLRGSSAINYEADIILILNEKYHIVAKVNIEFNPYQAQRFRDWVDRSRSRRTAAARTTSTSSSRSTSSSPASTPTGGRCRRSSSRSASTTTERAPLMRRSRRCRLRSSLTHLGCARSGPRLRLRARSPERRGSVHGSMRAVRRLR